MAVKIGHAHSDEHSKSAGGAAGDQTGKEVRIQDWYNRAKGWTVVFRAKSSSTAEKIATAMEQACANDNIGYDQNQRTTLYTKAKEKKWKLSKITSKCECDCSSLVAVCVNAAGIDVSKYMYTGNEQSILKATGKFELLTADKYLTKPDYLKRGDIILGPGHTAIVLSDGTKNNSVTESSAEAAPVKKATDGAKNFLQSFAGTYKVTANSLNVRNGAGTTKKIMTAIPKGTSVKCYGYYTKTLNTTWLYVQFTYKSTSYTGFASAKYLAK